MFGNNAPPPPGGQRPKKITKKTKLRDMPYFQALLRALKEPMELPAYIEGRSLVIRDCPICGKARHVHGFTDEKVGEITSRLSHCTSAPGVPVSLRVMEGRAKLDKKRVNLSGAE